MQALSYLGLALAGIGVGVFSGMLGIGGGVLMIPLMMYVYNVPLKTAIGTSLAVIIPTALSATFTHYAKGNIDWRIALILAAGTVIGGPIGAYLVSVLPTDVLKRILGGVILLLSLRMIFGK